MDSKNLEILLECHDSIMVATSRAGGMARYQQGIFQHVTGSLKTAQSKLESIPEVAQALENKQKRFEELVAMPAITCSNCELDVSFMILDEQYPDTCPACGTAFDKETKTYPAQLNAEQEQELEDSKKRESFNSQHVAGNKPANPSTVVGTPSSAAPKVVAGS